jgi:AraC family transcriptional activator FtrA
LARWLLSAIGFPSSCLLAVDWRRLANAAGPSEPAGKTSWKASLPDSRAFREVRPSQFPSISGQREQLPAPPAYLAGPGVIPIIIVSMPAPHRVVALALPTVLLLDLAAPAQIFGQLGNGRYRFEVAGLRKGKVESSTGLPLLAGRGLEALQDADTIVVPGRDNYLDYHFPKVTSALIQAHQRGARIMSICTGAFVLAEAGLLDGMRATTHWSSAQELASRFPGVTVDPDVLYVDEGSILTSAGVAAGLDLCLHVVRQDHGAAVVADMARWTVIAPYREGGQAQFIPASARSAGTTTSNGTTEPARAWALAHLDQPLSADDLARCAAMSLRTFGRRFRSETGTTPAQWLLEQRLRAAQSLLETSNHTVDQIARETGFGNPAALRAHFGRRLRTTPTAYRQTFAGRRD